MDYQKFLSKHGKLREPNLIRILTEEYIKNPKGSFFAGGMPNEKMFPFKEITVTYSDGSHRKLVDDDLTNSLQYGPSTGYFPLIKKWRELQKRWHSPQYDDWDVNFTVGSMEGCEKAFDLLVDEGDPVMIQTPTYTAIISGIVPRQPDYIEIRMDDDGVLSADIAEACEQRLRSGKPMPKLLYVNPTGGNPVGSVYTTQRKKEVYELARKYDFLILEDDPYYFLHYLDEQPTSFFSLDVDGRVLRMDSFSKVWSAGLRLGSITGPKYLLNTLNMHVQCSTLHPSSLSQVLVDKLLEAWTDSDLQNHFSSVRKFYFERREIMRKAIEKHFTGIAEWTTPKGGMFFWLKITVLDDVHDVIMNKCLSRGVFAVPGHVFFPDSTKPCPYVRLSYSQTRLEDFERGLSTMAAIIREAAASKINKNGALTSK